MQIMLTRRRANLIGFLACCGLIAYALYAQYVVLLDPCPLCLFQRFAVIGLGCVFLVTAVHDPRDLGRRAYAILLVVFALVGVSIAARHLWIQSLPAGSVPSCGPGLGYLFDIMPVFDVIKKVFSGSGECQHVDTLLGISWPWWVVISMAALGAWGAMTNWLLRK